MNLGKIYVRESEDQFEAVEYFIDAINTDFEGMDTSKSFIEYMVVDKDDNVYWYQYNPDTKQWTTYTDDLCFRKKTVYVDRIDIYPLGGDGVVVKPVENFVENTKEDVCDIENCDEHCAAPDSDMKCCDTEVKYSYQERERLRCECSIRDVIIEALAKEVIGLRNK